MLYSLSGADCIILCSYYQQKLNYFKTTHVVEIAIKSFFRFLNTFVSTYTAEENTCGPSPNCYQTVYSFLEEIQLILCM